MPEYYFYFDACYDRVMQFFSETVSGWWGSLTPLQLETRVGGQITWN